jgi:hypothetical protein
MWHVKLIAVLMFVSSLGTAVMAALPIAETIEAADTVSRYNVTQLLALVTVGSTMFAAWMFYAMTKTADANAAAHLRSAIALEGLNVKFQGCPGFKHSAEPINL